MKQKNIIISVIVVIIVGIAAFFGGMQYQKNQVANAATGKGNTFYMTNRGGANGGNGFARRFGQNGQAATRGEIVSADNNTMTLKLNDGSSKLVTISNATTINKTTTGTSADLKSGEQAVVIGKTNSDGSIDANSIQLGMPFPRTQPSQPQQQ